MLRRFSLTRFTQPESTELLQQILGGPVQLASAVVMHAHDAKHVGPACTAGRATLPPKQWPPLLLHVARATAWRHAFRLADQLVAPCE